MPYSYFYDELFGLLNTINITVIFIITIIIIIINVKKLNLLSQQWFDHSCH
uniref:Uncharacterized protein n=1 Tax=Anguilla anguilla TaxID=7936 RepID=A0A0E9RBD0_ANGAN